MRVRRSFIDPFSAGFWGCSKPPGGETEFPFWPFSFGDREGASTDLSEGACDEWGETRGDAVATEFLDEVMVKQGEAGRATAVVWW